MITRLITLQQFFLILLLLPQIRQAGFVADYAPRGGDTPTGVIPMTHNIAITGEKSEVDAYLASKGWEPNDR